MFILTKPTGETLANPSVQDVRSALVDVFAETANQDNFSSVQLRDENGWMLTAYGSDLVILDHNDKFQQPPSHITHLQRSEVEAILIRFLERSDDLSDLNGRIGYGS